MAETKRHYLVAECPNCHRFLLATSSQKTRTCPYCAKRMAIEEDVRIVARSEKAGEARLILQELKSQERGKTSDSER